MSRARRRFSLERLEARQMMATFAANLGAFDLDGGVLAPADPPPPANISVVHEFPLSSKPGAPVTLFLDFNGHFQHENVGGLDIPIVGGHIGGWSNFELPAYDRDGNPLTYSPQEQEEIHFIWSVVAEDYAPFNVNVTTVDPDPGRLHPERPYLRVVMSGGADVRDGENAGGFAAVGGYADGDEPNVAFVFLTNKNIPAGQSGHFRNFRFLADAASHEAGHAFGLDHYDADTGNDDKAPIMEKDGSFPARRGTWWGDDMDQLVGAGNGFGYRSDDHANGIVGASSLLQTNIGPFARGVISKTTDVDTFRFVSGGGVVTISVEGSFAPNFSSVTNLDPVVRLLNASGAVIAESDDPSTLFARIDATVGAGTFFVQVASHGEQGDVGQYTLKIAERTGPHVVSSQFLPLSATHATLLLTFNEPISALTFTASDVRVNGAAAGAGVVSVSPIGNEPTSFLVTYAKPATHIYQYTVSVGPNISDLFGNRMDQNRNGHGNEALDYYLAIFGQGGIYDPLYTPPKTRISATLSPLAVDTIFSR